MRVTRKGQVTIPKWVRDRYGVRPGTEIRFREINHQVVLEKSTSAHHPFDALYGLLKKRQSTDRMIRQLRGA